MSRQSPWLSMKNGARPLHDLEAIKRDLSNGLISEEEAEALSKARRLPDGSIAIDGEDGGQTGAPAPMSPMPLPSPSPSPLTTRPYRIDMNRKRDPKSPSGWSWSIKQLFDGQE